MNNSKKIVHFISVVLIFALFVNVFCLTLSASAFDMGALALERNPIGVVPEDLETLVYISSEEAMLIAKLFVSDALALNDVDWTQDTEIMDVISMYDQSDNPEITAYTVILSQGYVVVSAFGDSSSLIPEWSDKSSPIFTQFNQYDREQDKIIYLGALKYYRDYGNNYVEDLDGNYVEKGILENDIKRSRDISNIPEPVFDLLFSAQYVGSSSDSILGDTPETRDPVIENTIAHANSLYAGPFVCNDYVNNWSSYLGINPFLVTADGPATYLARCGPTAIANLFVAYRYRIGGNTSYSEKVNILNCVYTVGLNNNFYHSNGASNGAEPGVVVSSTKNYLQAMLNEYNLSSATAYGPIPSSYLGIRNWLLNDSLLYLQVWDHNIYGTHAVMCFAYCRLVSQTTGAFKTYLKVADGWTRSEERFIDLATTIQEYSGTQTAWYWPVSFY